MDGEENQKYRIAARENLEKPVIGELRARDIHWFRVFRPDSATRAIIMLAPIAAANISFCASHSSPCPPSQSTPSPGATNSATMLSIISKHPLKARIIARASQKLHLRVLPLKRRSSSRIGKERKKPKAPWANRS